MFKNCSGLTFAPELISNPLSENYYKEMFSNCINLSSLTANKKFTSISAEIPLISGAKMPNAFENWLSGNIQNGIFYCKSQQLYTEFPAAYLPETWKIEKYKE